MSLTDAMLLEGYRDPREIFIALRSDGLKGSGTIDDPFDGSTKETAPVPATSFSSTGSNGREAIVTAPASLGLITGDVVAIRGVTGAGADFWNGNFPIFNVSVVNNVVTFSYWVRRNGSVLSPISIPPSTVGDTILIAKLVFRFDDLMHQLTALPDTSALIHIGPGVFETRGSEESSFSIRPQLWQPKKQMRFRGSGIDITFLKLVYCDVQDGLYYAIGVGYGNLTDHAEVSDLTVDSNLKEIAGNPNYRNQPVTRGFDYARIACSGVALSGAFCRISRVKAINWGTQSPTEAFVIANRGAHPDFLPLDMPYQVIEDCVCVEPSENNRYTSTVIHTGGGHENSIGRQAYSRGAVLRGNYVDCIYANGRSSFQLHVHAGDVWEDTSETSGRVWFVKTTTPHGLTNGSRTYIRDINSVVSPWNDYFEFEYVDNVTLKVTFPVGATPWPPPDDHRLLIGTEFNALSTGSTRGCRVEDNLVLNASSAGPYQDTAKTPELIVRRNSYRNVAASTQIVNGNIWPLVRHLSLTRVGTTNMAEATSPGHGFSAGTPIRINKATNGAYNRNWTISSVTTNTFRITFEVGTDPPAGVDSTGYAVHQNANLSLLTYVSGAYAQGLTPVKHYLSVEDRIKITEATPSEYNGFFEVTSVSDFTFQYKLPSSASGQNAVDAALQRIWGIDRLIVEDNWIELRLLNSVEYGTPGGIFMSETPGASLIIETPPPHVHGEVIVRDNIIQMVNRAGSPFGAWGHLIPSAKSLTVQENVVDVPNANPLREWRSGTVRFFNNQSAAGTLIQGVNGDTPTVKQTELAVQIEDALVLNL